MVEIFFDTRCVGDYQHSFRKEFPEAIDKMIPIGDILAGNACIEIKTIPDFLDFERMRIQALHMSENFTHPLIVVLGTFSDVFAQNILNRIIARKHSEKSKAIHENGILAGIASIEARLKVPVQFLNDVNTSILEYIDTSDENFPEYVLECEKLLSTRDYQYADAFKKIRYFIEKANDGKIPNLNPLKREANITEQKEYILTRIKGISNEKAVDLLNHFGSVQAIANADEKSIAEIDGLGKTLSKRIKTLLN